MRKNIFKGLLRQALLMLALPVVLAEMGWGQEIAASTGPKCATTEKGLAFYDKYGKLKKTLSPPGLVDWKTSPDGSHGALLIDQTYVNEGIQSSTRSYEIYDHTGNLVFQKRSVWDPGAKASWLWASHGLPFSAKMHELRISDNLDRILLVKELIEAGDAGMGGSVQAVVILFDRSGKELWQMEPLDGQVLDTYLTRNGKYGYFSFSPATRGNDYVFFNVEKRTTKILPYKNYPRDPEGSHVPKTMRRRHDDGVIRPETRLVEHGISFHILESGIVEFHSDAHPGHLFEKLDLR